MTTAPVSEDTTRPHSVRHGLVTCAVSGLVAVLAVGAVITLSSPFAWAVTAVKQAITDQQQAVAISFAQNQSR